MKLRTAVLTAALGASVLTTVPVMVGAASVAYACDSQTSTCDDPPPPDDPPPDVPTDPGGGGGNPGDPGNPIQLEPVTVIGNPDPLPDPPAPPPPTPPEQFPTDPQSPPVQLEAEGTDRRTIRASQCFRNDSGATITVSTSIAYAQEAQISANASASAVDILSVGLGVQFNTTVTQTFTYSAAIPPGASVAVFVSYQTNLYLVNTPFGPEEVQATVPVETTAAAC